MVLVAARRQYSFNFGPKVIRKAGEVACGAARPPTYAHGHLHTHEAGGSLNFFDRFGNEKWSKELPRSHPEEFQIDQRSREEWSKRP